MTLPATTVDDPTRTGNHETGDVVAELEAFRAELTGYCYRMLGSSTAAEDAAQDTLIRAWRAHGPSRAAPRCGPGCIASRRTCASTSSAAARRLRPMDLGPASPHTAALPAPRPEVEWLEPMPDARALTADDPAEIAAERDSIRLAFVAALQHLPPRQRAVLVLREVVRWQAAEVAELLDTSVASVNSALQRARATLAERQLQDTDTFDPLDAQQQRSSPATSTPSSATTSTR